LLKLVKYESLSYIYRQSDNKSFIERVKMNPKLIISGAAGRMGRLILASAIDAQQLSIIAAVERKNHPHIGKDIGLLAGRGPVNIELAGEYRPQADVVIDFSVPDGAETSIDYCLKNKAALVLGTTGLTEKHLQSLQSASSSIGIVQASNMSLGMNLLFKLVAEAASILGENYDIEIVEQHHRFKKDAPSGSALTLAKNIAVATGRDWPDCAVFGREGKEALRRKGTIGIHAVRAGDITGMHSVIFSTLGETMVLSHTAHSRETFARGALRAAEWLIGKKPGLYSMADVLGIS
jgi:4-hydroxy-tetrahydrodipicolinate reductase